METAPRDQATPELSEYSDNFWTDNDYRYLDDNDYHYRTDNDYHYQAITTIITR